MLPSSSSSTPRLKYDVFLSFRGEDTRDNFISYLHDALCRQKIDTFIDYELVRGDEISLSLLDAIEGSKISVVVFSKGYASSKWCLRELVKILECKRLYGQIVIPVFYQVDPSIVRNQTGTFADALVKHEEQDRSDEVQKWRTALTEAANLSGWHSLAMRSESAFTEEIVKHILKRLSDMSPSYNENLVGVDSSMQEIESLLCLGSMGVYSVGIWGIGGIGKTTLADAVFNNIACHFEGSYFIQNVREKSEKKGGSSRLQEEILSTILEDGNPHIGLTLFNKKRLRNKQILIVFDDVTNLKQIEFFIGGPNVFGSGSRIIITTRDRHVLRNCNVDEIYKVEGLLDYEACELFNRNAFHQKYPPEGFTELSESVVKYAKGVPLALKVLGSFLHGRRIQEWESALNKLERTPNVDVQKVLKLSFDGLDDKEKNIFLDIACFFRGDDRDLVKNVLDASGFCAEIGISVLVDKSLITITSNKIEIHDLIQDMGREIVQDKFLNDPGKRSRLWHHEDIYHVLTKSTGTKSIEGISLDVSKTKEIYLNPRAFAKMHKLRLFKMFSSCDGEENNNVHICQGLESIMTELRYLQLHGYPFKSLPSNFPRENLVALDMSYSNVKQLWNGVKYHVNLKHINLSHCKHLAQIPDLSLVLNLETLILEGCTNLLEVPSSIGSLEKLVILNVRHCKSLRSLPNCSRLKSLRTFVLSGCLNLNTLLEIPCGVKELLLDKTAIKELPSSIGYLSRLVSLDLTNCSRLESLPSNIGKLKSLELLNLSGCSNLAKLPDEIGNLEALKEFKCEGAGISEVPSSMGHLKSLQIASFKGCKGQGSVGLVLPPLLGFANLIKLHLTDCGIRELPDSLGCLSSLTDLYLDRNDFQSIPTSIINLSQLGNLYLRYCKRLQRLHELPGEIRNLQADGCTSLESFSASSTGSFSSNMYWRNFGFANCLKLDGNLLEEFLKDVLQQFLLRAATFPYQSNFLYFPGRGIPEWFNYRTVGSIIRLELLPGWFSRSFVGFALCFVVAFRKHHVVGNGCFICFDYHLRREDGTLLTFPGKFRIDLVEGEYISSDHVFVRYHNQHSILLGQFDNMSCNEAFFKFSLARQDGDSTTDYETIECCKVKQCGVRLLYDDQNPEDTLQEEPHLNRLKACIKQKEKPD